MAKEKTSDNIIEYMPNGKHVVIDIWGCKFDELNDVNAAIRFVEQVVQEADMTMLNLSYKKFQPQGLTVVGLLSESHISLHTYPEHGYIAIDLFTCGDHSPEMALKNNLPKFFTIEQISTMVIDRGCREKPFGRTWITKDLFSELKNDLESEG